MIPIIDYFSITETHLFEVVWVDSTPESWEREQHREGKTKTSEHTHLVFHPFYVIIMVITNQNSKFEYLIS